MDLPFARDDFDSYVHRIGRTARAGAEGEAIALCAPEEAGLLRQIEKLMKIEIPVGAGERPTRSASEHAARRQKQGSGNGRRSEGRGQGPRDNEGRGQRAGRSWDPTNKPAGAKAQNGKPRRPRRPKTNESRARA